MQKTLIATYKQNRKIKSEYKNSRKLNNRRILSNKIINYKNFIG